MAYRSRLRREVLGNARRTRRTWRALQRRSRQLPRPTRRGASPCGWIPLGERRDTLCTSRMHTLQCKNFTCRKRVEDGAQVVRHVLVKGGVLSHLQHLPFYLLCVVCTAGSKEGSLLA